MSKVLTVEEIIYAMVTQNTGEALCDSGGTPVYNEDGTYKTSEQGYGRHWERNCKKSLKDFKDEPSVIFDSEYNYYTVSLFHYLTNQLSLDDVCEEFNSSTVEDSDVWLEERGYKITKWDNTYNYDNNLSQDIQFALVKPINDVDGDDGYLLIMTHNGCDIRGGYSDEKLFVPDRAVQEFGGVFLLPADVSGTVKRGKHTLNISNTYDGYNLTVDDFEIEDLDSIPTLFDKPDPKPPMGCVDEKYEYQEGDIVNIYLNEY